MRVFELARELDMTSKDLISDLEEIGIVVNNHMTALSEDQLALAMEEFGGGVPPEEPSPLLVEAEKEAAAAAEASPDDATPEEEAATAVEEEAEPEVEESGGESEADQPQDEEEDKTIYVKGGQIQVKELAICMDLKPNILIAELMKLNVFASINANVELSVARQVAEAHGFTVEKEKARKKKEAAAAPQPEAKAEEGAPKKEKRKKKKRGRDLPVHDDDPDQMVPRAPVVTFLGHVDHGKTSLLDKIRATRVVDGEAGGITQHIGAYTVEQNDHSITFLDTPGHAAFTAMRARGAMLTDIAVLVVAADDGIMPQTREAVQHAKAAKVTIVVAINKIDLPGANVDRVAQQLMEVGLVSEDYGGDVGVVPVSAMTGDGIDDLLERLALEAEVLELKANPNCSAEGYVVEAKLEPGMGPTATVLVKRGTLKVGDAMVCGAAWGRIKSLINDKNVQVRTARPSDAVKILGLTSVPEAGAAFTVAKNDRSARSDAESVAADQRREELQAAGPSAASLDELLAATDSAARKTLNIIVKTDVQGTLEAVLQSLEEIESDKVELNVVLSGVGTITENDILLAKASDAIVVGFHVPKATGVDAAAKHEGVEIRLYSVIYELFDDVRAAMTGLLEPLFREQVLGHAEVRQVFEIGRRDRIAGCMVTDGRVTSRAKARVLRDRNVMYEGTVASLKRFQNDASEVREGQECGIGLDNFRDIEAGDVLEMYVMERIEQQL